MYRKSVTRVAKKMHRSRYNWRHRASKTGHRPKVFIATWTCPQRKFHKSSWTINRCLHVNRCPSFSADPTFILKWSFNSKQRPVYRPSHVRKTANGFETGGNCLPLLPCRRETNNAGWHSLKHIKNVIHIRNGSWFRNAKQSCRASETSFVGEVREGHGNSAKMVDVCHVVWDSVSLLVGLDQQSIGNWMQGRPPYTQIFAVPAIVITRLRSYGENSTQLATIAYPPRCCSSWIWCVGEGLDDGVRHFQSQLLQPRRTSLRRPACCYPWQPLEWINFFQKMSTFYWIIWPQN